MEKTTMQLVESVLVETMMTRTKLEMAEQAIQQMRKLADNFNLPENKDRTFTGEFVYLAIQDTLDSEQ